MNDDLIFECDNNAFSSGHIGEPNVFIKCSENTDYKKVVRDIRLVSEVFGDMTMDEFTRLMNDFVRQSCNYWMKKSYEEAQK